MPRPVLDYSLEYLLRSQGHRCVAGLDEAGRGPLAGPVVAAAVVLDPLLLPEGLADSKVLPPSRRESLYELILTSAEIGIAIVSHATVDAINIRQASLLAMRRALAALPCRPDLALVDGNDPPDLPCPVRTMVKGDALVASIAAASIVAKVTRDRIMRRLDPVYPAYGFAGHVGYATAQHVEALGREGPCPFHRRSFSPIRRVNAD